MSTILITATRSMHDYASSVVGFLKNFSLDVEDAVEALNVQQFADGEMEVMLNTSVRGKTVVLFANCARNKAKVGVNSSKIELYNAVDALKRSRSAKIIVFEPYISCSRSDRTTQRTSVGLWVHFKTLVALGCKHIVTYQLHSDKSKSMLDPTRCIIDDIPAMSLLQEYLCDHYIRTADCLHNEVQPNWVFCSVDAGGEKVARRFADAYGSALVIAHKQRDYTKANTIAGINILSAEPIEGKTVWIVDDMIDTGGSVVSMIHALTPLKPREVNIIATHAVFSGDAPAKLKSLKDKGLINRLVVTDTVYCPENKEDFIPFIETVPSTMQSARIIRNIVTNSSMGGLLLPLSAEQYLSQPNLFASGAL
ncbi:MAG: ribose-phosphate diphosphokinase [Spirochaetaceae bacterium]|nr:ribose-phosphate diphosphokinase [Spirochaetaceae bacterium]